MHGRAEEALDEERRRRVGADVIGERTKNGAVAELIAIAEEPRGCRCESHALALEAFERVQLALQARVFFFDAAHVGAGAGVFLAPVACGFVRGRERRVGLGGGGVRDRELLVRDFKLALREPLLRRELFMLGGEGVRALCDVGELTLGAFAFELQTAKAIAELAYELVRALERVAPDGRAPRVVFFKRRRGAAALQRPR